MSGFFDSNTLGTFNTKKAETIQPKVFAATGGLANGQGLSLIAPGTTFYQIWASSAKSAQVFNVNNTKAYRSNDGDRKEVPGSANSAKYTFRTYSKAPGSESNTISLYDDDARRPSKGSYLVGAIKIQPKSGVKITFDILVSDCKDLIKNKMKNGADKTITDKYPWGTQPDGAVGSSTMNSSYNTGKNRAVRVTLNGTKGDYIEIDMDGGVMSGKNFAVQVDGVYYGSGSQPDDVCSDAVRIDITFKGAATIPKYGCMDTSANNTCSTCDTKDNTMCNYTVATPTITSVYPTSDVKVGGNVHIKWAHNSSNISTVKLYEGSTLLKSMGVVKSGSFDHTTTKTGPNIYKIITTWDKPGTSPKPSTTKTVGVVAATSYVLCDPSDIHRNTDGNGECLECKNGYYTDPTTGKCTTCDPTLNRDKDGTGKCTTCLSGYAEHTDGTCQKVGCMTYTDGTSASDDYNYDSDAIVNDSSLCETPDGQANSGISGCMDNTANNYSDTATSDDGSCTYDESIPDVDCELSAWSDWTEWSSPAVAAATDVVAVAESGTRTRSRTVVTASSGTGAVCEHLEETETKDPETGKVVITTAGGGSTTTTTTTTPSPVMPIILGIAGLGVLALLMRR